MYCNNNNQIDCKVIHFQIEYRLRCEFPLSHSRIFLCLENASFNLLTSFWYPPMGVGKAAQTTCIKCYKGWTQGGTLGPPQPKEKKKEKKLGPLAQRKRRFFYFLFLYLFISRVVPPSSKNLNSLSFNQPNPTSNYLIQKFNKNKTLK